MSRKLFSSFVRFSKPRSEFVRFASNKSGRQASTAAAPLARKDIKNDTSQVPLSEQLDNIPSASYVEPLSNDQLFQTQVTRLDNGIRVATEPGCGEFCTIGVVIDAGSRYEVAYPTGVSHFLEKVAFNSTCSMSSAEQMTEVLTNYGAIVDAQTTRDTSIYASSCHMSGMNHVLEIIADAVLRPKLMEEELSMAEEVVLFDVADKQKGINCEPLLTDWIHAAGAITRSMLYGFMSKHYTPERIVVAGVGIEHGDMVAAASEHFEKKAPIWETDPDVLPPNVADVDTSIAQYTGGIITEEHDLGGVSFGPDPFPEVAHFVVGLESCSYLDSDFVPFCVLNSLMGGGSSFSAGGPGKGMYTRLYTNVLNRNHWMTNAISYNHAYADTGLFCLHGSAPPEGLHYVAEILVNEFLSLTNNIGTEEFERAKNQLQSMLLMNLEQKPVMFEDVGRQVMGHGFRRKPMEYMHMIKCVQKQDIYRIVERLLSSKAAVVGYGKLNLMPQYEKVERAIAKRNIKEMTHTKSFFR